MSLIGTVVGEARLFAAIARDVDQLIDQVARVGGAERPGRLHVMFPDQVVDHRLIDGDPTRLADTAKDFPVLLFARIMRFLPCVGSRYARRW